MDDPNKWRVSDKVTVICQARRSYIDHFIPVSGTGVAQTSCLIEVTNFLYLCYHVIVAKMSRLVRKGQRTVFSLGYGAPQFKSSKTLI